MFSKKVFKFTVALVLMVIFLSNVISNATTTLTSIEPIISYDETSSSEGKTSNTIDTSGALSSSVKNKELPSGIQIIDGADSEYADIIKASQEASGATEEQTVVDATAENQEEADYEMQSVEDDIYAIGEDSVVIDKYVNGNVYVIAKNVTINSTVNGNVYAIAENIVNNGRIYGSIYEIASNVSFENNATISKTAYILSENCTMPKDVTFSQDVKILTSNLNYDASVYRNMYVLAEKIILGADSYIKEGGSIVYSEDIQDSSGDYADIIKKAENVTRDSVDVTIDFTKSIAFRTLKYLSAFILIVFIYTIVHKYNLSYEAEGKRREAKAGMTGLLHIILAPILAVLLIISVIGMPIGIITLLSWIVISTILARPVVSMYFAKLIYKNRGWNYEGYIKVSLMSLLIYLIIDLISLIPVVGGIVKMICIVYGYGIVVSAIRSKRVKCCCGTCEKEEKTEETTEEKTEG